MLNGDQIKLQALSYAERDKIVNSKTIKAIEWGIRRGYETFSNKDCIGRLKAYFNNQVNSHDIEMAYSGRSEINKELMQKNLELINQIEL